MALITVLSGKGSPGVTTTIAALATMWPSAVLAVDADPSGGDLVTGWLGPLWTEGWVRSDTGVVSFATATRRCEGDLVSAEWLSQHVQSVPRARHVRVLAGVSHRAQAAALGPSGWRRLSSSLRDLTDSGPDVLVDVGRWMPGTPWPVMTGADMVVLALRPGLRHVRAATPVVRALRQVLPLARLGLAVCAGSSEEASETAQILNLPVVLEMPHDPASAAVFSDGASQHQPSHHSPLLWSARCAARRLHAQLRSTMPHQHDTAAGGSFESAVPVVTEHPSHATT